MLPLLHTLLIKPLGRLNLDRIPSFTFFHFPTCPSPITCCLAPRASGPRSQPACYRVTHVPTRTALAVDEIFHLNCGINCLSVPYWMISHQIFQTGRPPTFISEATFSESIYRYHLTRGTSWLPEKSCRQWQRPAIMTRHVDTIKTMTSQSPAESRDDLLTINYVISKIGS